MTLRLKKNALKLLISDFHHALSLHYLKSFLTISICMRIRKNVPNSPHYIPFKTSNTNLLLYNILCLSKSSTELQMRKCLSIREDNANDLFMLLKRESLIGKRDLSCGVYLWLRVKLFLMCLIYLLFHVALVAFALWMFSFYFILFAFCIASLYVIEI